jgi:hypothetical protein
MARTLDAAVADARPRSLSPFADATSIGLKKQFDPDRWAANFGILAMLTTFLLPGSLISYYGLYSLEAGGNPLTKLHPATYLAFIAAWFALYGGGRRNDGGIVRVFINSPALACAIALIVFVDFYSLYFIGLSGIAVYIDTYLAAMLVALAFERAPARHRRILGYIILTVIVVNVVLAVAEVRLETHFLPQGEVNTIEAEQTAAYDTSVGATEFRGFGFWTHPLTGATATALACFLILGIGLRWRNIVALLAVFIVGLLAYGGRGALLTIFLMLTAAALFQLASGLATRRLKAGFVGAFIASVVILPAMFIALTSTTDIGARVMTHMYVDDSAQVRLVQWRVLYHLDLHQALMGVSTTEVNHLKELVGLTGPGVDIENPWLLAFLGLGIVGFPFLLASLFFFMLHLGRRADSAVGWLVIIATLLICSTSNSLGRKSPDLVIMTSIMVAIVGFSQRQERSENAPTTAVRAAATTTMPPARALADVARVRPRSLSETRSRQA